MTETRLALRVTGFAFVLGPTLFLAVAAVVGPFDGWSESVPLTIAAVAAAFAAAGAHVVFTRRIEAAEGDEGAVRGAFTVRGAVTEAPALLACVAYLIEGRLLALATAGAVILFMLAVQFPTSARMDAWLGE